MIRVPAIVCFLMLIGGSATAQTGSITGTVVDQTGIEVPGATVQLTGPTNAVTTSGFML